MEQKNNKCQYECRGKIRTYEYIHECNESALKDSKEGYCIFHERSKDKDITEFQAKIDKKIQNQAYNFTGFHFPNEVNFSFQVFTKDVCFWNAVFKEKTDFGEVRFEKGGNFRGAEFKEKADFIGTRFKQLTPFEEAKFRKGAEFGEAEFKETADFEKAEFQGTADFRGVDFEKRADFGEAKFRKRADFVAVEFKELAYFRRAEFQGTADFVEAEFREMADFRKAEFKEWAYFAGVEFKDGAGFEEADFNNITFWLATFSHLTFLKPRITRTKIIFSSAMLENVSLTSLNLKPNACIDFSEVRLFHSQLRRRDVAGHILQEKNKQFIEAKDVYVILKNNFHSLGNYDDESWAFRREKEMERKSFWHFRKEYKKRELGEKWSNKGIKDCFYPVLLNFEYTAKYFQDYWFPTSWKKVSRLFSHMAIFPQHPIPTIESELRKFVSFVTTNRQRKIENVSCKEVFKALGFYISYPMRYSWSTFLKYLYGWGEWPWLIFLWCAVTIFMFSGFYRLSGDIVRKDGGLITSYLSQLYFSGVTFTALGYGDYCPVGVARFLAFLESFFGIFLIALFVFSFARRTAGR